MKKLSWFWRKEQRHSDHQDWARAVTPLPMAAATSTWSSDKSEKTRRRHTHNERLRVLVDSIKDFQLTHGSLVKLVQFEEEHTVLARPIGVTLYPTRLPRATFDEAEGLQVPFNDLYAAVSSDEKWLKHALRPLLTKGSLAAKLWTIHADVKREGFVQDKSLGLFRSDYMLQSDTTASADGSILNHPKQVEFNTYSCAGTAHFSRVSAMHRYLCTSGAYKGLDDQVRPDRLPQRDGLTGTLQAFDVANKEYRRQRKQLQHDGGNKLRRTCVLMIVQPHNVNIADERPIEFGLWKYNIPTYHIIWGTEFLNHTYLTKSRELFFIPPGQPNEPVEVSVVYHRAGYDEVEYDIEGIQTRLRVERSRAIKCPSILGHLAGFKKVQQVLSMPGQVERFLEPDDAKRVRRSFVRMYPLDDSMHGLRGRELATMPQTAAFHILKPSLEGGGHNIYRSDIPDFLDSIPESSWRHYILMEVITPPPAVNAMMGPTGLHAGAIESELGIIGACMWKNHNHAESGPPIPSVDFNSAIGITLKAKARGVHEMSVIKGYGCFDSPLLID